jgi:hypothetical protein
MLSDDTIPNDLISCLERGTVPLRLLTDSQKYLHGWGSRNSISINCQFYKRSRCQQGLENKTLALYRAPDMGPFILPNPQICKQRCTYYPVTKGRRVNWWREFAGFDNPITQLEKRKFLATMNYNYNCLTTVMISSVSHYFRIIASPSLSWSALHMLRDMRTCNMYLYLIFQPSLEVL